METILQISKKELRSELRAIVKELRAEERERANEEAANQLLTADEVVQMLKISNVTLWRWAKSEYLVPIFIGGARKYRASDVQAIIEGGQGDE